MRTESVYCVGCNKCVLNCPTRANNAVLENGENKIYVDEALCIKCGKCIDTCDHSARLSEDDTALFFGDLEKGKKISVIAAPSIKHNVPNYKKLFAYLQSKGVTVFYDVSLGADITTWAYIKKAQEKNIATMISAPCPVVVSYIENFKPELISLLAPVQSPAVCTAVYMKKYMGIAQDIAFLSPCIAKSDEFKADSTNGVIGYNVTYKSIFEHIKANNIEIDNYPDKPFDNMPGSIGFTFSRPGGLAENVKSYLGDSTWIYQIEGINNITKYLNEYEGRVNSGKPVPFLVDALNCDDGCNLGTATLKNIAIDDVNNKTDEMKNAIDKQEVEKLVAYFDNTLKLDDFERNYASHKRAKISATDEAIEKVFSDLEKYTETDRKVNCLSCGYGSCYEFANAVALGKNHESNCFRYAYKKVSEQTEELVAQGQSLYEQRKLLENKNKALVEAIDYAKQVEETLKIEREINEFAVQTKYELVSLINVEKRTLTIYKQNKTFEKVGIAKMGDYDTAAKLVISKLGFEEDKKNFASLNFENLVATLNANKELILEYRLPCGTGNDYRWKRVIYRYFTSTKDIIIQLTEDIHEDMLIKTELKEKNENLELNEQCFKALAEQTNKVILEWDFETNKITAMSNFKALFGRNAITVNDAQDALSVKAVHEDDRDVFVKVFATIKGGDEVEDARFRIADNNGNYHWCSLSGLVVKDSSGKPYRAIGSLENIENRLNREIELRQKAETDQLTGLYNKAAVESLIKDALQLEEHKNHKHALIIIDVDNFKNVNDKLGHLYGDTVLAELAEELRRIFRTSDIVGRAGGDEFFVMLKNFGDNEMVTKKATDICKNFGKTYSGKQSKVSISASVGIAVFPKDGEDYETLFKCADLALYDTKAKGKNGFTYYNGQKDISYQASRTEIDSRGITQKNFKENRVEYIFKLLYESDKEGRNIESALQFVAQHFRFSRGYVFETDSTGQYTSNTFEWVCRRYFSRNWQPSKRAHILRKHS